MSRRGDGEVRRYVCRRCGNHFDFLWEWGPGPWYCNDCADTVRQEHNRRREQRRRRHLEAAPGRMRLYELKDLGTEHGHAPCTIHRNVVCLTCLQPLGRKRGAVKANYWFATPAARTACHGHR